MVARCAERVSCLGRCGISSLKADTESIGKGKESGIMRVAKQYGVEHQFIDCVTYDVTRGPLRRGGWIDAIITDPPCEWGVSG
jgi:hypothetical protein